VCRGQQKPAIGVLHDEGKEDHSLRRDRKNAVIQNDSGYKVQSWINMIEP
jgi:hypothetical protein